jgi:DNA-binding transcriptional ArsR family regulator
MGITKTFGFAFKINEMADVLKALGNPARLKIIQLLMSNPKSTCGDFLVMLPLAQSTVSKHLSELKRVKLIKGKNVGNNIYYSLNEKTWQRVTDFVNSEIVPNQEVE